MTHATTCTASWSSAAPNAATICGTSTPDGCCVMTKLRVDEPVGELLDRFEQAAIDQLLASNGEPQPVTARRQGRTGVTGPLAVMLNAPDVLWAGRTATNPVQRIAAADEWQVRENRTATHPSTGARLEVVGTGGAEQVVLSVPLSGTWIEIRFTLPATILDGGAPVVSTDDAASAMRSVLAIAAGVDGPNALPAVQDGPATMQSAQRDAEEAGKQDGPATMQSAQRDAEEAGNPAQTARVTVER